MINKKLKKDEFILYELSNVDIKDLILTYIKLNTIVDDIGMTDDPSYDFHQSLFNEKLEKRKKRLNKRGLNLSTNPDEDKLTYKFQFIIHYIILNCYISNDCQYFNVKLYSAKFKDILGDYYSLIIRSLVNSSILSLCTPYEKGVSTTVYIIHPDINITNNIRPKEEINRTIKGYIDKNDSYRYKSNSVNKFYDKFNNKLKKIKLLKLDEAIAFTDNTISECNKKLDLYKINLNKIIEKLDKVNSNQIKNKLNIDKDRINRNINKLLTKINHYNISLFKLTNYNINYYGKLTTDKNKRIYHILTNINKNYKYYLNIKYILDVNNSHPLLLNSILYKYYKINKNDINLINDIINNINLINNIYYIHTVSNKSLNSLLDNMLFDEKIALKLPLDVLKYIIMTSKGYLWDFLLEEVEKVGLGTLRGNKMDRGEIKIKMFKDVFYSRTTSLSYSLKEYRLINKDIIIDKKYAKLFNQFFPNVYTVINENKPTGRETKLSNDMMKLESDLFHKILKELYKNRKLDVISLHDAILVLDTSDPQYTSQFIEEIMREEYNKIGLCPTISIEDISLKLKN